MVFILFFPLKINICNIYSKQKAIHVLRIGPTKSNHNPHHFVVRLARGFEFDMVRGNPICSRWVNRSKQALCLPIDLHPFASRRYSVISHPEYVNEMIVVVVVSRFNWNQINDLYFTFENIYLSLIYLSIKPNCKRIPRIDIHIDICIYIMKNFIWI